MAVYEGARPRTIVLPRRPGSRLAPRRSRQRCRAVGCGRPSAPGVVRSRMSIVLGAIVVAFVLAFFSLAQDVRVSATGYDIDRLVPKRERLEARAADLRSDLNRLGRRRRSASWPSTPASASCRSPTSSPPARTSIDPMLGRTDSRVAGSSSWSSSSWSRGPSSTRLAYWQVVQRDELAARPCAQTTMTYEIPSQRGAIYDRSGTVVLATTVQRDRLAANPKLSSPRSAAPRSRESSSRCSASRATPRRT